MASSSFPRQRSGADEHFLEQNPWANPLHPSHQHRQHLHRQVSGLSRTATPSSTPVARPPVDLPEPQGSASTIADQPSGRNSSMVATPGTGEAPKPTHSDQKHALERSNDDSTPIRIAGKARDGLFIAMNPQENPHGEAGGVQLQRASRTNSPSQTVNRSRNSQTPSTLPKPLPFKNNTGTTTTPLHRTVTPGRFDAIKHEDHFNSSRKSPMPRFDSPPINAAASGSNTKVAS